MGEQMSAKELGWERQQVEEVFRLGGGELESGPWVAWTQTESSSDGKPLWAKDDRMHEAGMMEWHHRYWYDGVPEYDDERSKDFDSQYRTLVNPGGVMSSPHRELYDGDGVWVLTETFISSGEAPCPLRDYDPSNPSEDDNCRIVQPEEATENNECGLCGEEVNEEHGYIYLGVCSYEAVYRLEEQYHWEVVVGNIGTVHRGQSEEEARKHFDEYSQQSEAGIGRGAGEDVVLMRGGEPYDEFTGIISRAVEGDDDAQ